MWIVACAAAFALIGLFFIGCDKGDEYKGKTTLPLKINPTRTPRPKPTIDPAQTLATRLAEGKPVSQELIEQARPYQPEMKQRIVDDWISEYDKVVSNYNYLATLKIKHELSKADPEGLRIFNEMGYAEEAPRELDSSKVDLGSFMSVQRHFLLLNWSGPWVASARGFALNQIKSYSLNKGVDEAVVYVYRTENAYADGDWAIRVEVTKGCAKPRIELSTIATRALKAPPFDAKASVVDLKEKVINAAATGTAIAFYYGVSTDYTPEPTITPVMALPPAADMK